MIFFDLDNTLVDDNHATARGLDALHAEFAHAMAEPRAEIDAKWQSLMHRHFNRYLRGEITMLEQRRLRMRGVLSNEFAAALSDADLDHAYSFYLTGYENGWQVYHDTLATLEALSPRKFGIITNGDRVLQNRKLKQTGLAQYFSVVMTSDECGTPKPDPRIFQEACRRGGVAPERCMHVGDYWEADVEGALQSGLQAVWIARTPIGDRVIPSSVRVIKELSELPALVDELLAK